VGWPGATPYTNPYAIQTGFGPGNVLNGQANVINAQGNLMLQQEQARLDRETANQAKLDTKKKTLDWKNYERANTWTFAQEQERDKSLLLMRMINSPSPAEITTGKAENVMLPYLAVLVEKGVQGPVLSLDPRQLQQINVTNPAGSGNIGPLREGGKVRWPTAVRGPTQKKLDVLLPQAVAGAVKGDLDPDVYAQVRKDIDNLQGEIKAKFYADKLDGASWIAGKRFLESLNQAAIALQNPDVAKQLNGTFQAVGRTVQELVMNMTRQGLQFAPASPGGEPAYYALHSAMVGYAAGVNNGSGFRAPVLPVAIPGGIPKQ
jgi:hypothetical protein